MQPIEPGTHMCLIYSDRASAMRDVQHFIQQSIDSDGCSQYFAVQMNLDNLFAGLEHLGCTPEQCAEKVTLSAAKDVYFPDGKFKMNRMLKTLADSYTSDSSNHSGKIHYTGEMDWAADKTVSGVSDVVEYERQVNAVCKEHPFSAVCQYDAKMFEPEMLVEIMRAHPYVLIDGMVIPSPDYVGP